MGSSPSPPDPPDPRKTAEAQGQMNKETAIAQARLNMFDEYTPYGSVTYTPITDDPTAMAGGVGAQGGGQAGVRGGGQPQYYYDREVSGYKQPQGEGGSLQPVYNTVRREVPRGGSNPTMDWLMEGGPKPDSIGSGGGAGGRYGGAGGGAYSNIPGMEVPRYRREVELSPEQQQLFDLQQELGLGTSQLALDQMGRIDESLSQPFNMEGLPDAPGQGDFGESRQRVEDALYGSAQRYLDPRFEEEQRAMETQLANMGITRGTDAFQREMDNFNRRKMAQYGDARDRAISAGGQEQSRLFGLASNARERALQERLLQRSQPLNEASALMGTGPGVQMPQFSAPPQTGIQPPDYQGAVQNAYQGEMANYQQQAQANNQMMGQIFGLGGTAMSAAAGMPGVNSWLFG